MEGFNSILVRLKECLDVLLSHATFGFNSILVRLKAYFFEMVLDGRTRFNSILVRLKVDAHLSELSIAYTFQFHTGSIKRMNIRIYESYASMVSIPYWFD